jgi:hypothetical protein
MARTNVPVTDLLASPSTVSPGGTTADPTNGHTISGFRPEVIVLRVNNTTAGPLNAIVRAGSQPLANASGQGDLTVSVAASGSVFIGPLDSSRFLQNDGSLSLDLQAGFAGNVTAFRVSRR